MDAFAPPSIRADSPLSGRYRALEAALLTLALALSLFSVPNAPNATLDGSWQEMLVHAHAQGIQFGRDLVFTWGPWGFLCSLYHLGAEGAIPVLIWQTAGQLLVAVSLVILTHRLVFWRRIAFAAALLASHWLFLDVVYFVLITLVVVSALMRRGEPVVRLVAWALLLGFLAQIKFTYFALSAAGVLASAVCWARRRSWGHAWGVGGGYAVSVVAAWLAAGQNPGNLHAYLRRSLEIVLGYGDAMGLDESWPLFVWGAGLALICVLFAWSAWRALPERAFATSVAGFLAFALFLVWKESFTRADLVALGGHVFGFFTFVLILAPVVPGLLFPERRWHLFDGSFVYCLAGVACFDPAYYTQGPRVAWERIYGNMMALARLGTLPQEWQRAYENACERASLPEMRATVGRATVDVYDFSTGTALLNRMNLDSRPIFQGYSAYTASLEALNLRFYQSGREPDYLLWNDERIDNRYPGQDDAMLVASLSGHYAPLFPEGDYWLFKRESPVPRAPLERRLLFKRTVRLSEEIELPAERDHAIWLTADPVPDNLGRLRALAYRPAAINIAVTDDAGGQGVWRLLPRVARGGFILVPTLGSGGDMASLLRGEAHSWVRSFHFEAPQGQEEFWSHVDLAVFALPGIPLHPEPSLPWLVQLGIVDRLPISVASVALQEIFEVREGRAMLLHAEGEIVFAVPAGATRFWGGFGIREGAYSGSGHTAGVRFYLDGAWTSGRRERLWSRFLDPVGREGDRGTQRLDVALPADRPARLILHTAPGLADDNRWDWSYVAALRFDAPVSP